MNMSLFVGLLFALQFFSLVVGIMSSRNEKGKVDYFLGSRQLGFWPLTMTLIATLIGGGSTLGAAEEAYRHGWIIFLYPLGGSLGFVLLAFGLSRRLSRHKITTVAALMQTAYKSSFLQKAASLLSIISLAAILIGQIIAARKFMHSLGVSSELLFLGFWALVILYTAWGGLKAVAFADVIQGLFFMAVFAFVAFMLPMPTSFAEQSVFSDYDLNKVALWFLMPMLYMLIEQDVGQRCLAAKSQKTFTYAALFAAAVALLISLMPICAGMSASSLGIPVPLGSSALICAINYLTNPLISAAAGAAIMAAIVSTADSEINAISANISQDFTKHFKLSTARWITVFVAFTALLASYFFHNIIDLIVISFELAVYCLLVPLLMALYKTRHHKISAIFAMLGGAISFILLKVLDFSVPHPFIALPVSLLGFLAGEAWVFLAGRQEPI